MMTEKVAMVIQTSAVAAVGVSSWFIAQASALDTAERLIGGSTVAAAAIAIVYLTLRFSVNQRESWTDLIASERKAKLDAENEADRWRKLYEAERERCKQQEGA